MRRRLWLYSQVVPWVAAIFVVYLNVLTTHVYRGALGDFGSFMAPGRAFLEHRNAFGIYPLTFRFTFDGHLVFAPNLNPPITIYPLALVGRLNPVAALRVWYIVTVFLYALLVTVLCFRLPTTRRVIKVVWAASLAPLWQTLGMGQIYVLLLILVVGAWLCLENRRWYVGGLCIGVLIAVKPIFGLWAFFLLAGGAVLPGLIALGTAGLLSLLPLVISGFDIYRQWLAAVGLQRSLLTSPGNSSLPALAARMGFEPAGYLLSGALVLALALYIRSRRPDVSSVSSLSILAALLAGPLTWVGYLIFLVPVLWRRWSPMTTVAALLLVFPIPVMSEIGSPLAYSIYALPLILLLSDFLNVISLAETWSRPARALFASRVAAKDPSMNKGCNSNTGKAATWR